MNASPSRKPARLWKRAARILILSIMGMMALLAGCQSRLIYFPNRYVSGEPEAFIRQGGQRIDYDTGEGRQSAWLIPPRNGKPVERLWILCGGNGATALGFDSFCRSLPFPGDAFLMVDYPGYGACEGSPHPSCFRESFKTVIPLAASRLQLNPGEIAARTCVFGHSLGCAAALIAVEEFKLRRAVLCSPFTSTMEMARVALKLPLGFLVWHRFDNRAGLAALEKSGGHAWIFHGTADNIIPAEMSRTLAREFPATVTFKEVPGTGHNDILQTAMPQIVAAMRAARETE